MSLATRPIGTGIYNGTMGFSVLGAGVSAYLFGLDPLLRQSIRVLNTGQNTYRLSIPNGNYAISFAAGSSSTATICTNYINIEGNQILNGAASPSGGFVSVDNLIAVSDGELSIIFGPSTSQSDYSCMAYLIVSPA